MQFTNLPYGEKEVQKHLASGIKLTRNVSEKADEAFIRELQDTDPARYKRLMQAQGIVDTSEKWTVGTCSACSGQIKSAPFVERGKEAGKGREYCSRACRDGKVLVIPDRCRHCSLVLPTDVRKDALYCDSACKKAHQRSKANLQTLAV